MYTFADIEEFRKSTEAIAFADRWIIDQRQDSITSDAQMNLTAWISRSPPQALGIILTLLDRSMNDAAVTERIAMGPVEQIVEWPDDDFVPMLQEAIRSHPAFELCTRYRRNDIQSPRWTAIGKLAG